MKPTSPVRVRLRIDFGPQGALGPGKIALLEAIAGSGSLSRAAAQLGMSYRRAWGLLRDLNREFENPVATASVGGAHGGGAQLTEFAGDLIAAYRAVERAAVSAAHRRFAELVRPAATRRRAVPKLLRRAVKKTRRGRRRPAKRR
jgi:molybdate transport system regulatory protein